MEDYQKEPAEIENDENTSGRERAGAMISQIGVNMLMLGVLALLAYLAWQRFGPQGAANTVAPTTTAQPQIAEEVAAGGPMPESGPINVSLSPFPTPPAESSGGIQRKTELKTLIPTRARVDVITYTVQSGDTLFTIAENYNLKPETILWGNFLVLEDNPHLLKPDQVLNILPTNGTYYEWHAGDTLNGIASFFKVEPQAILEFAGNPVDLTQVEEGTGGIEAGTWLIVPGGKRAIKDWGPPAITRQNPASASHYGPGACGSVLSGAYGTGTFVWPTTDRNISGYGYSGVHPAVDIGGAEGNPIYAADSGVVVYAGWSDYGYGYLIVIDHGNGWQSAYAHLSAVAVTCGQSVYQGGYIGAMGTTGNSSGPHLHFELAINGAKINPIGYIQ